MSSFKPRGTREKDLLRQVITSADRKLARSIYADYLEEIGDGVRAQFLRASNSIEELGDDWLTIVGIKNVALEMSLEDSSATCKIDAYGNPFTCSFDGCINNVSRGTRCAQHINEPNRRDHLFRIEKIDRHD